MTDHLAARLARVPGVLFSDMLPEPGKGRATYTVYEAARRDDGTWKINAGFYSDYGTSTPVSIGAPETIYRGLDFITMMETMHRLETNHPNAAQKRPRTGWRRPDVYRDHMDLWIETIAVARTSSGTLHRTRRPKRHKAIYRRPS